jgi:lipoyl-dependent peroxiredoxin
VLGETPYSYRTRFENVKGTNPEELTAAAHADALPWRSASSFRQPATHPSELTEATISLEPEGQGFRISRSALALHASVTNVDKAKFTELADIAEKSCPVSKVLNPQVTLDAKLESAK